MGLPEGRQWLCSFLEDCLRLVGTQIGYHNHWFSYQTYVSTGKDKTMREHIQSFSKITFFLNAPTSPSPLAFASPWKLNDATFLEELVVTTKQRLGTRRMLLSSLPSLLLLIFQSYLLPRMFLRSSDSGTMSSTVVPNPSAFAFRGHHHINLV